ncbi:MAG: hypothetical protein UT64_C0057G0004 [Candidatus Falkowbacteria bacterium GW2011_GWF2_39_8]|uniref:DUF5671 domain-containing protein n=1 Tax=Candidatus Falkowbacteria bacterium GW2011_GWF2_39_8 TaxID=1618642 RepID=A0A0G0PTN2_9BACT|nr:MAG: hypothetical protein UT64_C0057G0004 [Candidatus Falkowbacteria bacterium GW2011_GWF2_39_8]
MEQQIEQQNNSAKFAFFYLLSLVSLIFMTTSVGIVIFQIINKLVVDLVRPYAGMFDSGSVKFAISAIIIAAPIYYLTTWQINKNLYTGVLTKNSGVRRWLSYFILLVTSVVMLGWAIGTLNNFLNGDITLKFVLKALASVVIAGTVFSYYFYDIKREQLAGVKDRTINIFFYTTLAVVIITLVSAFFFIDSPKLTRDRNRDDNVLNNFNAIDNSLNSYYLENKKLPSNLEVLITEKRYLTEENIKDGVTGQKFDYKPGEDKMYELCATFLTSNKDLKDSRNDYMVTRWPHDKGYQCLNQRINSVEGLKEFKPLPVQ